MSFHSVSFTALKKHLYARVDEEDNVGNGDVDVESRTSNGIWGGNNNANQVQNGRATMIENGDTTQAGNGSMASVGNSSTPRAGRDGIRGTGNAPLDDGPPGYYFC